MPGLDSPRVVVLDRDGTIIIDRHYLNYPDGLEFEPGAVAGLRRMISLGHRLVVVTNQSGIARGYFSVARLEEIHARLLRMLEQAGVRIEGIYFCPHGPDDGCDCRKPGLGMMQQAARELGFNMADTIVIGDKESDVEFGRRAGGRTILIAAPAAASGLKTAADVVASNLEEAAEAIAQKRV